MKNLKTLLEKQGFTNVFTYLQTGNILFRSTISDALEIKTQLEALLFNCFSVKTKVIVVSPSDLSFALENLSFRDPAKFPPSQTAIGFLSHKPDDECITKLKSKATDRDLFVINGQVLYVYCSEGFGKTKLTLPLIESVLNVTSSLRNLNTMTVLAAKMAEL